MKRPFPVPLAVLATCFLLAGLLPSRSLAEEEEATFKLVGVKKCKMCHKKASSGNQYGAWLESRHAKAYETLGTEKALEAAEKCGVSNPQEAPECLKCHVTAFPVLDDIANQKITLEEGVSCESCHGAGSGYFKKSTMQALRKGEIEPASVGLTLPPTEETCTKCHTPEGNPFYKEFNFEEGKAKIAHPIPTGSGTTQ